MFTFLKAETKLNISTHNLGQKRDLKLKYSFEKRKVLGKLFGEYCWVDVMSK